MMCGVLCVEEMCGELGSESCMEEVQGGDGDDDKAESEPVPSFTEALCAFEYVRAFMTSLKENKQTSLILKVYSI
jgi:hypothetical protein